MAATSRTFELFPTPVLHVPGLIDAQAAAGLAARLASRAQVANDRSAQLAHSEPLGPGEDEMLDRVVAALGPHLVQMGEHLFGESLRWLLKEIWANVLDTGGRQAMHNHANAFVSGVVYLTPCDESARTLFMRGMGGPEFTFRNTHAGVKTNAFHAEKWVSPSPAPGDALLFPSWLLHEVPPNLGAKRVTLAFNAVPHRLDAWGYGVSFEP